MAKLTLRDGYIHVLVESHDQMFEFGRQFVDEPSPLAIQQAGVVQRLIIAEMRNTKVGRQHVRLERVSSDVVRMKNIHRSLDVRIDQDVLSPDQSREVLLPTDLKIGDILLRIEADVESSRFRTVRESLPFEQSTDSARHAGNEPVDSLLSTLKRGDHWTLLKRMKQMVEILQASASSPDFMDQVARASVNLVELDHAAVVLWRENNWEVKAYASARPSSRDAEWYPSRSLLNQVRSSRKTTWSSSDQLVTSTTQSLQNVVAYVASPIRGPEGEVIGAVYGDRRTGIGGLRQPIEEIDAQFVEILACGIAGGLQRLESEREVVERRLQFEKFIGPEVARQIEENPAALTGQDADVTILFCDIAGFSRISEQLPPQQTFEWINDVMTTLSECVKDHGGTIVDYVGDELIAMWGAPFANEQHACDACRAAIAMVQSLPKIDSKWQSILHVPTQVGVGVNSGIVRVGNTGCQLKLKYGPLGSRVNIASRIQGATRYLRTPVLITGDTARLLPDEFHTRRLCQLRVKNIDAPIDIFELCVQPSANWVARCTDYAVALTAWENGSLQDALNFLVRIVANYEDDVPAKVMLSRAIDFWSGDQSGYDPVWKLPSK